MLNILVTGGAGFLGSHLVDALLGEGHRVTVIDSEQSGFTKNVAHHTNNERFRYVKHNVQQVIPLKPEFDQIYHLACPASPPIYQANGLDTLKTNVLGTMNVLEFATECKARVLLASTSEVYGEPLVHPQYESYWGNVNPMGLRSCYDVGKRCAETMALEFGINRGTDYCVARIFNTYGPRMHPQDGRVISNFITQALTHQPLTVYGDGSQTRSFCYVSDLIRGLVLLMNSREKGPINLGNPDEHSIMSVVLEVQSLILPRSDVVYKELPLDDPTRRRPDITRAQALLGWEPTVDLTEGLNTTISYFEDLLRT